MSTILLILLGALSLIGLLGIVLALFMFISWLDYYLKENTDSGLLLWIAYFILFYLFAFYFYIIGLLMTGGFK